MSHESTRNNKLHKALVKLCDLVPSWFKILTYKI